MSRVILTDARVKALRPRKTAFDIRDGKLRGFGIRVLPSGRKRFFVHCQHRGERIWKIVGDAATTSVNGARSRAAQTIAAIRRGEEAPRDPAETLFEAVAEIVFRRRERVWKPGTLNVNRCYLKNQILPRFHGRQVADIDRRDVRDWFASLRATPVAADRSMPVLSVIMREAEAMGLRPEGSNPCLGIRRYRRKGRTRFLSDDEMRRLSARLSAHANGRPQQVAVIRLLLLTGCRKSEILTLRWSDYREGHLFLRDSKTGPRTVWLSQPARNVLDGLDRTGQWVFPAARGQGPRNRGWLEGFWDTIRAEAGLRGVRLHDLRHTHASIALRQGETVLTIARLLGHRKPPTHSYQRLQQLLHHVLGHDRRKCRRLLRFARMKPSRAKSRATAQVQYRWRTPPQCRLLVLTVFPLSPLRRSGITLQIDDPATRDALRRQSPWQTHP